MAKKRAGKRAAKGGKKAAKAKKVRVPKKAMAFDENGCKGGRKKQG